MNGQNQSTLNNKKEKTGGISMRNLLNKQLKNEKGLTLIELLAVIVILAIIAAIAIPAIGNIISNSKSKAVLSDATQLLSSAKNAIADGECGDPGATTLTCDKKVLDGLVEGVTLDTDDKITKTATGYSVYYNGFKKLNDKYSEKISGVENSKTGSVDNKKEITDKVLADAMGKK